MNTAKRWRTAVPGRTREGSTTTDGTRQEQPRAAIAARARYRFDLALARGPIVVVGYLGLIMLGIIVVSATLMTLLQVTGVNGGPKLDFGEAFWQSLLRVLDSGTFAADAHWTTRAISLVVTLSGIFLAGSLIGLIANAVDQKIESLRKGRSQVLEQDHTLVLGWSPRLPTILAEIVIANENHRGRSLVVLADRPKDEMEDELRHLVPDTRTTRVVCRTGNVGDVTDLHMVNIEAARSVIVLAGPDGDAGVVKTVLAVRSIDTAFAHAQIVAELEDASYASTLRALTDNRVATVQADDVISQVTAQACHQGGLAGVFRDLLDFDGDEIYFTAVPELSGHTYGEALLAFETASVIGLKHDGRIVLNPPSDHRFVMGDELIAISADDDTVVFAGFDVADHARPVTTSPFVEPQQRIALVGWSSLGVTVLHELDQFLGAGSQVDVLVDRAVFDDGDIVLPAYTHCAVTVHALEPGLAPLLHVLGEHHYDQAIVLGYRRRLTSAQADARSMLTLLALRKAFAAHPSPPRVVAEMIDRSNVEIAQTTGVDDFIVSDELSSLMIAQLSERVDLQDVFAELFDAEGCFVSLHPARFYAPAGDTTFATVVGIARERGASALGYRIGDAPVVLNPAKSTPLTFGPDDQVLVLAPRNGRAEPVAVPEATGVALDAVTVGLGIAGFPPQGTDASAVGRHARITDPSWVFQPTTDAHHR